MLARRTRISASDNTWPGFVDALSTLLMVIIFLLVVFFLSQFILSQTVSQRDEALDLLRGELDELRVLLNLERTTSEQQRDRIQTLTATLNQFQTEKDALNLEIVSLTTRAETAEQSLLDLRTQFEDTTTALEEESARLSQTLEVLVDKDAQLVEQEDIISEQRQRILVLGTDLDKQVELTDEAQAQLEILNQQLSALRAQLASLQQALEASEAENAEQQAQIADLGSRLNVALASKVQQLQRYQSQFFGRLRQALGDRPDIRVVGDRFVFQSEVLFGSGSAELGPEGQAQLATLANTLLEIADEIPDDLPWILRIDGHTDSIPIANAEFRNNWELSTGRALSVVENLVQQGIPADRLAAAGFGEFHPIEPGTDEIALRRNRRIEIKLTER